MKLINVVYDYEYDDISNKVIVTGNVDIIKVPDFVSDNIDNIVQEFFEWTELNENRKKYENENGILCIGTNEFVEWLNENYSQYENQEIIISEINTKYNSNYSSAWF